MWEAGDVLTASCTLKATGKSRVPITGQVEFAQRVGEPLAVFVNVTGLTNANHGFHVHTFGDVSDLAGAMATTGHFIGNCNNTCRCGVCGLL